MDAEIAPDEVHELLADDADVRVVDIRPEAHFERGHIPGSENIPFHALADDIDRLDDAERVVTVCPHGKSSVQAARLVGSYDGLADDARVESMAGGLEEWDHGFDSGAVGGDADADTESDGSERDDSGAQDAPF